MSDHRARATTLLVNYFEAIAKKAGMKWDRDYTAEIEEAIDEIIKGAVDLTPTLRQRTAEIDERLVAVVRRLDAIEEGSLKGLENSIAHLQQQIDTPNWRDRR